MSVRVVARIRPLLPREFERDIIVRADRSDSSRPPNVVKIPSPKNGAEEFSFTFHSVYDESTTQEELFNAEVAPHVRALFQGVDITLFAYGVTGTGKTHTMRGGLKLADRGVIPRLLSHVYRRGKKISRDSDDATTVDVALSYYEIYNDKVYDLLEPPEKRTPTGLPLREKDNRTHVVGLSERSCADLRDFEELYIAANQNRVTAATKLNAHSSRSHAILRVKVTQTTRRDDGSSTVRESTASAIDLAGSEDNRRTDNDRLRMVESAAINKSLFVLSQCVDAISRGERRIPYRESKMTRILSLGQNNGITLMILNLAPVRSYHLDTLSSLNVSSRAKRIEVREIENEVVFKQPPRSLSNASSSTSSSMPAAPARQPLRALTSNTHNIQTGMAAAAKTADKPIKAFAVYTDRVAEPPAAKPVTASMPPPRMGPLLPKPSGSNADGASKRTSETADQWPSKLAWPTIRLSATGSQLRQPTPVSVNLAPTPPVALVRPAPQAPAADLIAAAAAPVITAEIERIIERKVAEALAARAEQEKAKAAAAAETPAPATATATATAAQPEESVERRLDALERRIQETKDERADGLRFLLLARQNKEAGDEAAALHYYEQALPYFPGQAKLLGKIEKLRAKGVGRVVGCVESVPWAVSPRRKRFPIEMSEDEMDADVEDDADDGARSSGSHRWVRSGRRRTAKEREAREQSSVEDTPATVDDADDEALTPRRRHLWEIVRSRDVARGRLGVAA